MDVSRKAFLSATDSKQFWLPIIRKKDSRRVLNTKLEQYHRKTIKKYGVVGGDWNSLLYLAREIKAEKEYYFYL